MKASQNVPLNEGADDVAQDGQSGERANATLFAYSEIKRRIQSNQLEPGKTYLQQVLAEMLNVSRTPVREAVIRLAEENFVEIRPRYGVYVRPISLRDISEMCDFLAALEAHALVRTTDPAPRLALADRLSGHQKIMTEATAAKDVATWIAADEEFHLAIVDAGGNQLARAMADSLCERMSRARAAMLPMRQIPAASNKEHELLIEALRQGDAAKAAHLLTQHRARAISEALDMLRRRGVSSL